MRIASVVAGFFVVLMLAVPLVSLAQDAPGPSTSAPPKAAFANHINQRIKSLHDRLKITAPEELQWTAVAQAMRDSAQIVGDLVHERREKAGTMNAVDDLRSYQAIAEAHATGVAKLASAFKELYAVMPPDQQKNADAVFAASMHRPAMRMNAK
ncbi:MAG: Spy/CpxP family protein refolding chaperone [Sulfuricaulis sp.]